MTEVSLYNSCLRRVFFLLRDGFWKSRRVNLFCSLPPEVVHDLVSTTLHLQRSNGFRAADLELLLRSGLSREFKIHTMDVGQELGRTLRTLASCCQNLEALTLTELTFWVNSLDSSEALEELLRNSPNLRSIHCEVKFDLKALRNCKKLQRILLHFHPEQPWSDFLGEEHGRLQPLDSLELFTLCSTSGFDSPPEFADYIVTLLMHCPALTSLGFLETSRALAQLHRTGISIHVKLRSCLWGITRYPDRENPEFGCPEWIRDSVAYYPSVEELFFYVYSLESITYLSSLRNLVFLDFRAEIEGDLNVLFCNVLKDIGHRLKHLAFYIKCPIDLSVMLQNCPNLEALRIWATKFTEFSKPVVSLPNLKYLSYHGIKNGAERRILPLFFGCHSLREIFLVNTCGFDDKILDKFLRSNSLSNLKVAYIELCGLTMRGFKKFFRNAPELERIEIAGYFYQEKQELEKRVKRAMLETNHKALFNKNLVRFEDEFFLNKGFCKF